MRGARACPDYIIFFVVEILSACVLARLESTHIKLKDLPNAFVRHYLIPFRPCAARATNGARAYAQTIERRRRIIERVERKRTRHSLHPFFGLDWVLCTTV